MSEAFVVHVVLHLSEDRFRFYRTVGAVLKPPFRGQSLTDFAFVFHEPMVDLYLPVAFSLLVTSPSQRTSLTVSRPVENTFRPVSAVGLPMAYPDTFHVLPHRADEVVPLWVIVQVLYAEDVILERALLLFVEKVVLDLGLNVVGFHKRIIGDNISFIGHQ